MVMSKEIIDLVMHDTDKSENQKRQFGVDRET